MVGGDNSFGLTLDNWDDFDDFETPSKGKVAAHSPNNKLSATEKSTPANFSSALFNDNKNKYLNESSGTVEKKSLEATVADKSGLSEPDDSPIKTTKHSAKNNALMSDCEDDAVISIVQSTEQTPSILTS